MHCFESLYRSTLYILKFDRNIACISIGIRLNLPIGYKKDRRSVKKKKYFSISNIRISLWILLYETNILNLCPICTHLRSASNIIYIA